MTDAWLVEIQFAVHDLLPGRSLGRRDGRRLEPEDARAAVLGGGRGRWPVVQH